MTEKQKKEEYIGIVNKFHIERDDLLKEINGHESEITTRKQKIRELEKEIKKRRPKLEDCDGYMICKRCDIYSMKFGGLIPDQGGSERWYECKICGYETYHT